MTEKKRTAPDVGSIQSGKSERLRKGIISEDSIADAEGICNAA